MSSKERSKDTVCEYKPWQLPNLGKLVHAVERDLREEDKVKEFSVPDEPSIDIEQLKKDCYEQGVKDTNEKNSKEIALCIEKINVAIKELGAASDSISKEFNDLLLKMVTHISTIIFEKEISANVEHIISKIEVALSELPLTSDTVDIYISSESIEAIRQYGIESGDRNIKLKEDIDLRPGVCRVETNFSKIDISLRENLDAIMEELYK